MVKLVAMLVWNLLDNNLTNFLRTVNLIDVLSLRRQRCSVHVAGLRPCRPMMELRRGVTVFELHQPALHRFVNWCPVELSLSLRIRHAAIPQVLTGLQAAARGFCYVPSHLQAYG